MIQFFLCELKYFENFTFNNYFNKKYKIYVAIVQKIDSLHYKINVYR